MEAGMQLITIIISSLLAAAGVTITEHADGETYQGDWLTLRVIVENDNELPDSVHYALNGLAAVQVPRLNTDWHTYMADNCRTGFSESPAPVDNTVLWTAPVTGTSHEFSSSVVVNGTVFHVSDQLSTAYALDAATGEILWEYDVVDHVDDAVSWYQNRVYVAADSAWCLDASTGERIWAVKPSASFKMNGTPVLSEGVAYFSFAPNYNTMQILALDADDGALKWITDLPNYSTGCMSLYQDRLLVPTYQGSLYALDCETGAIIWENSASAGGYWDSSPVVVDGNIYICGFDGTARAFDAETGTTLWESTFQSNWYIAATPAFAYGNLFFADQVDSFQCLNSSSGSTVWSVPGVQHGSPGVADQTVFFGEGADRQYGKIRALSALDGTEIWSYQTGGAENYSSPAITDGVVYIAGMDGLLYAFGTGLRYTYLDDLYGQTGDNELIATAFSGGVAAAADTVNFTVTGAGIDLGTTDQLHLSASPNPFVSTSSISFDLSAQGNVSVEIFDLAGRRVATLVNSSMTQGQHSVQWDGTADSGEQASAGLFLCRIQSGGVIETTGLCLLR